MPYFSSNIKKGFTLCPHLARSKVERALYFSRFFWYSLFRMAELAIIRTGGKQYLVEPGIKLKIEKLLAEEGAEVVFDEVLLLSKDGKANIGAPLVEGAKVKGKVLAQGKGKKLIVFKFRKRKRSKTKQGHRQKYTEVEITSISA